MKVLLTIGHTDILLPDDTGVVTILKALSRGLTCYDRMYEGRIELDRQLEVGMKYVPVKTRITGPKKDKEPELLCLEEPKVIIPRPAT